MDAFDATPRQACGAGNDVAGLTTTSDATECAQHCNRCVIIYNLPMKHKDGFKLYMTVLNHSSPSKRCRYMTVHFQFVITSVFYS